MTNARVAMNSNTMLWQCIISILTIYMRQVQGVSHAILYPKVFRVDTEEVVVVTLDGYGSGRVNIAATLQCAGRQENMRANGQANEAIRFAIAVPGEWFANEFELETRLVTLRVDISFPGGRHSRIVETSDISVSGESDNIFVMTDRPIYKPGESVKIRVAALNPFMLPTPNTKVQVTVETEHDIGIWRSAELHANDLGFFTTEYVTTELTPLATYYVVARITKQGHFAKGRAKIRVDKYVLPSFSVELTVDRNTVSPGEEIRGNFKARYSFGADVIGKYGYKATLHIPGNTSHDIFRFPSDPGRYMPGLLQRHHGGKGTVRIITRAAERISGMTWAELTAARATISVSVSVRGDADGVVQMDQIDGILVSRTPYTIDASDTSTHFIPGLEHSMDVVIRDVVTGKPVDANVPVSWNSKGVTDGRRTDANGRVRIIIETARNDRHILLNISAAETTTSLDLRSRNVNQGFLRISSENSYGAVGSAITFEFLSQSSNVPNVIHYVILSRGSIIDTGRVVTQGRASNMKRIEITRKMSPKIRIVGYFVRGSNFISDSISVSVEEVCISEELDIHVEAPEDPDLIRVVLTGQPGASFAIRAVDKSAMFLNEEGHLLPDDMYRIMKLSDMGCPSEEEVDAMGIFMNAGLSARTSRGSTPEYRSLNCSEDGRTERRRKRSSGNFVNSDSSSQIEALKKQCYYDGRKENLGGLHCERRIEIVQRNFEGQSRDICCEKFLEGCVEGKRIREEIAFRSGFSRTTLSRFDADSSHVIVQSKNDRRTDFSEGWMWRQGSINQSGIHDLHKMPVPDSITTHEINAISIHGQEGSCIAKPAEVTVFKKVFIKLFLPFSIKLMEQVQLRAAVFNYEDHAVTVRLQIQTDEFVCSRSRAGTFHDEGEVTIESGQAMPFLFTVIPLQVPTASESALVIARIVEPSSGAKLDELERELKIEEPGELREFSNSFSLDPKQRNQRYNIELRFPDGGILPGSRKCEIFGYMTFLGPIIEFDPIDEKPTNLKSILRIPYGCGEQNMMVVGPNVFAIKYLKGAEQDVATGTVAKFIEAGYTREISHRNSGKWSVWSHHKPTVWLNAYVNKVFLHAREIWPIMNMIYICDSIRWMGEQQTSSGSFSETWHAIHTAGLHMDKGGDIALTAYVLISLSEKPVDCNNVDFEATLANMKSRAVQYLRSAEGRIPNLYTAALVTYALSLVDRNDAVARRINNGLLRGKQETEHEVYWIGSNTERGNRLLNIETTAYVLMTQIKLAGSAGSSLGQNRVDMINKAARWMANQQSSSGGYGTSQTTVIAIQALVEYAIWIEDLEPYMDDPGLQVALTVEGATPWNHVLSMDDSNKHFKKNVTVPNSVLKSTRTITATTLEGVGRGMLSYRCTYRTTKDDKPACDYRINVDTELHDKEFSLRLNISKMSPRPSGMAIIDIGLMTGYTPVRDSLEGNKRGIAADATIDDYEISDTNVILYLEKIDDEDGDSFVMGFKMTKEVDVKNPQPAQIHVYDYYQPETSQCTTFYSEPETSESIMTYCRNPETGPSSDTICKCMDGGCPICRTRSQQVNETCSDCADTSKVDLVDETCKRNYAYMIKIDKVDDVSMPLYVRLESTVLHAIQSRDVEVWQPEESRTFVIHRECFDSVLNAKKNGPYFMEDEHYLIFGKAHDKRIISSGESRIDYLLDGDAMVEKAITDSIDVQPCKSLKLKKKKVCGKKCRHGRNFEHKKCVKCRKVTEKLQICINQKSLIASMSSNECTVTSQ